ncbi:T9SS type A sorting domain-containing protein [Lacibacter sediminis]|uniref:T9SS type A sorting domain-containing protein n=1 Tax=Lacibacter sediminis TaxID=2760713 RepID=A0A7G5XGH7_9BACT|nr:T9SS type A sorting domain-containing protein [Lacibacter sediminis]QNA44580.1 T9SS type A sorting domain-containing protein [Lacibacter sediminis]
MKSRLLIIPLLLLSFSALHAQQHTVTTGGKATGINGSVTYSVGELIIPDSKGPGGSLSGGLQLPYEISVITSLPRIDMILSASVFPNPTTNTVQLKIADPFLSSYRYSLYDSEGKLLKSAQIRNTITEIELGSYSRSFFILNIQNNNRQLKSFKIVKAK